MNKIIVWGMALADFIRLPIQPGVNISRTVYRDVSISPTCIDISKKFTIFQLKRYTLLHSKAEIWKSVNNSKIQSYKSWQFDWCKRSDSAHRTASFIDYYESIYSAYNRLYLAKHTRTIRLTCNELNPCKRSDVYAKSL